MKKYLFFVSLSYSYSILRPIQDEIWRRGEDVAWFIQEPCPMRLRSDEKQLKTIEEVMNYNPIAVFTPENYVYDFFPGIKVEVFHGLYYKRTDFGDHYKIRGLFDLYCTTSGLFTPHFKELEKKYQYFKVVETGWSKFDDSMPEPETCSSDKRPVIIYAPTFTIELTSAVALYDKIEELINKREWDWIFSFHPKMNENIVNKYKALADKYTNAVFSETEDKIPLFKKSDVMLSDTSSVIYEFLWFNKPAVTYKNTFPASHLFDIDNPGLLEETLEEALRRPANLIRNIRMFMDEVHPFRDGKSSARILDATDEFIKNYKGKIKKKPLNLFRKLKLRKKAGYFPFGPRYKSD